MVLTHLEAAYFYDLWIPLLDHVNKKYHIIPKLYGMKSPVGLPIDKIARISEKLWENPSVVKEYISTNRSLNDADKEQLVMWMEHYVPGPFVCDRHLKDGSILISMQTDKVYLVKGIYSPIREMLENMPMPQIVSATIIPFNDILIHDGILIPHGMTLGKNYADLAKDLYRQARKDKTIIRSL